MDITIEDAVYFKIDFLIQLQYECLPIETVLYVKDPIDESTIDSILNDDEDA